MAYSNKQWDKVRVDHEVNGLSFNALAKKHPMVKAAILSRSKKESWQKSKTDRLIAKTVVMKQELADIEVETSTLSDLEIKEVTKKVTFALEMTGIYENLEREIAQQTMKVAQAIEPGDPVASMSVKNLAQALQSLKDKGKIGTQVNIQNNSDNVRQSEIKQMTTKELLDIQCARARNKR